MAAGARRERGRAAGAAWQAPRQEPAGTDTGSMGTNLRNFSIASLVSGITAVPGAAGGAGSLSFSIPISGLSGGVSGRSDMAWGQRRRRNHVCAPGAIIWRAVALFPSPPSYSSPPRAPRRSDGTSEQTFGFVRLACFQNADKTPFRPGNPEIGIFKFTRFVLACVLFFFRHVLFFFFSSSSSEELFWTLFFGGRRLRERH